MSEKNDSPGLRHGEDIYLTTGLPGFSASDLGVAATGSTAVNGLPPIARGDLGSGAIHSVLLSPGQLQDVMLRVSAYGAAAAAHGEHSPESQSAYSAVREHLQSLSRRVY